MCALFGGNLNIIQFELLDETGMPINPVFNNKLLVVRPLEVENSLWDRKSLSKREISIITGEIPPYDSTYLSNSSIATEMNDDRLVEDKLETNSSIDLSKNNKDSQEETQYELIFPNSLGG